MCRSSCGLNLPSRFGQVPSAMSAALFLRLPVRIGRPGHGSAVMYTGLRVPLRVGRALRLRG
jgi:hypothetical protein